MIEDVIVMMKRLPHPFSQVKSFTLEVTKVD